MRAGIGQTAVATLGCVGYAEALLADGDGRDPALRQLVEAHKAGATRTALVAEEDPQSMVCRQLRRSLCYSSVGDTR